MPAPDATSLKRKSLHGVAWTTLGYGASQALRLLSSLLMTHLLAPEHFGAMAIVNVFLLGLTMFSDIGMGPNIIQSPRGSEPMFLNSAWTLQFIRGVGLWCVCIVAGYPLALFYGQPELAWLIPVSGLTAVIYGLNSTNLFTSQRDLKLAKLTLIELAAQILALVAMIGLAKFSPSVWVLVAGSLIAALVKVVASHSIIDGMRNSFVWDGATMRELMQFGRWIFLSSVLTYISTNTGSLILGKLVSVADVGVFSIAVTLAKSVEQVFDQIAQRVLLPIYAKIKFAPASELRRMVRKIRIGVMAIFLPILLGLIVGADWLVGLLFDQRYQQAGWILRVYALGLVPIIVSGIGPFYLALGNSKLLMKMSAIRCLSYLSAMSIGWLLFQTPGVISGMACYTVLVYVADVFVQRRYGIWLAELDMVGFLSVGVIILGVHLSWGLH